MSLLDRFFNGANGHGSPELLKAVAWAVDRVDPRLKHAGGYPDCYRKPVAGALEYVRALAAQVPGPVRVTHETFGSDPVVHAMFALPEELHEAMAVSKAMQEFLHEHPGVSEVYALVCMRRRTKNLLGMELQGDVLHRDVRQQAVFFTDCTIAEPGLSEAESRERIAWGFFESLVAHVANRIAERKLEKANLEVERDQLLAQLRTTPPQQRAAPDGKLAGVLKRLAELVDSLDLGHYCRDFEAVLLDPGKHLFLNRTEMNLDTMGIVRDPASGGGEEVVFCDLIGRDRRRWTVTMMYCNHVKGEVTVAERLAQAQRWLGM